MRSFSFALRAMPLLALAAASGCGDSHAGSSVPIPIDRVDDELATVVCDYLERCPVADNDAIGARLVLGSSATHTCEQAFLASKTGLASQLVAHQAAGTIVYDGARARACIAAYQSSCAGPVSSALTPAACEDIAEGTRAIGQACGSSDECAGDAFCNHLSSPGACGTCVARSAIGAVCDQNDDCQKAGLDWGSICESAPSAGGHCVEIRLVTNVAAGAACGRISEEGNVRTVGVCAPHLYCTVRGLDDPGTCAAPVPLGVACESSNVPCVGDAVCAPSATGGASTCQAVTIRTHAGEACGDPMLMFCNPLDRLVCTGGTCQSTGDGLVGSMCRGGDFTIPCNDGLYCDGTTMRCTTQKADGAPCTSDRECTTGSCSGSTCGWTMCAP